MKISWRKNPKTEDGWPKRIAISFLGSLASFIITSPIAFLVSLNHLQHAYPDDTQNFLGALTSAVAIGLFIAGLCFFAALAILYLLSLRGKPAIQ